jgi:hypothetical protein
MTQPFGTPPAVCKEATWFQVRVEGLGAAEIHRIDLDISAGTAKTGSKKTTVVKESGRDFFETQSTPASTRW